MQYIEVRLPGLAPRRPALLDLILEGWRQHVATQARAAVAAHRAAR